jgi:hypothetical protein
MTEHILENIEAREAESFLSALHALSVLSPQALKEFCYIIEKAKEENKKKNESGIFHRMKKRITEVKMNLASYIYF